MAQTKLKKALEKMLDDEGTEKPSSLTLVKNNNTLNQKKKGLKTFPVKQNLQSNKSLNHQQPQIINNNAKMTTQKIENSVSNPVDVQNPADVQNQAGSQNPADVQNQSPNKIKNSKPKDWNNDVLKAVEAKKFQTMSKIGAERVTSSPLQMHIMRSESLRIAQEKILELEEEIHIIRQTHESLISASKILKNNNDNLNSQLEDYKYSLKDEKDNYKEEKKVLLSTLEEAKKQILKLNHKKTELENRLSRDLYGIRARENSLESRIEILKMESSVLQRAKDKKIIELQREIQKIKENLKSAYKKYQETQSWNTRLQESSRRTVSALRATIFNLEGLKSNSEETVSTQTTENK